MSDDVLVLWDIDGTLLNSGGVGRDLYDEVFLQLFGRPLSACAPMAGRTDRAIILETLVLAGVDEPRRYVDPFIAGLGAHAQAVHEAVTARGQALPGAADVLAALAPARSLGAFAAFGSAFPDVFDKTAGDSQTAAAHGAASRSAVAQVAAAQAAVAHATAGHATAVQTVPLPAVPAQAGPVATGPVRPASVQTGGVQTGGVQTGGVQTGGVQTGGVQTGGVHTGGVHTGGVQTGTVQTGTVRTGTVQVAAAPSSVAQLVPPQSSSLAQLIPPQPTGAHAVAANLTASRPAVASAASAAPGRPADGRGPAGRVYQTVLTGSIRPVAEMKLAALGLRDGLDLCIGAYGDDHEDRTQLVHVAQRRAAGVHGRSDTAFDGTSTVVVGDTPLDVSAALSAGARVVGVATGLYSEADLVEAGAHAVLADLTDTSAVLRALLA
jgi:phosphoglycolate phosphatase-like HAD superfamily hydrolase